MTKAFILMTTEIGTADDVYDRLLQTPGVISANIVAGTYDVVAVIEGSETREIGRLVIGTIQKIDGVMSTVTLLAIR